MQDSGKTAALAMRLGDALEAAATRLARAGIASPRREARLLAAHVLGAAPAGLLERGSAIDAAAFEAAVARREAREPMAFITSRRGFWTLDLAVSRDTLIPRADSETLIEAAVAALPDRGAVHQMLDLGTGTGCLLLAALAEFPASFGVGVDIAPGAAALASRNASASGFGHRAAFLAGDWAGALRAEFDLVLCNPPYIETAAIAALMEEVARHEPAAALDGGADGLDAYRRVTALLPRLLSPRGIAVLELGAGQERAVAGLAAACGLTHVLTRADLGGMARAMVLRQGAG